MVNGEKLIYKGKYLEAEAELGYVLSEITKEGSNSREKLIQNILIQRVYYDLGEIQYRQDKYEKARPYFEKVVNQPAKSYWEARAFYRLGLVEYNMRNYKGARGHFYEVVSEYSTSEEAPEAQYYIGLSYNLEDDEENARQSFRKFLCLFPNHPWADKVRGKI